MDQLTVHLGQGTLKLHNALLNADYLNEQLVRPAAALQPLRQPSWVVLWVLWSPSIPHRSRFPCGSLLFHWRFRVQVLGCRA